MSVKLLGFLSPLYCIFGNLSVLFIYSEVLDLLITNYLRITSEKTAALCSRRVSSNSSSLIINHASLSFTMTARGVVPGGVGVAMAPQNFGRSVNPTSTGGKDYAHLITTCIPGFSDPPTALTAAFKQSVTVMSVDLCLAYMRVA